MKRGLVVNLFLLISSIFFIIILTGLVVAVHEAGHVEDNALTKDVDPVVETPVSDDAVGNGEVGDDGEDKDLEHVSEQDVEKFLDSGGVNSGLFYIFDVTLDKIFLDEHKFSEERAAEIVSLVKEGNIEDAKKIIELYRESADVLEKEVSPDKQSEVKDRAEVIQVAVSEIINDIPEDDKDDFEEIVEKEKKIKIAVDIAAKISELCTKLVELGEFKKASEVCKLDKKGDEPEWLRGKKEGWNKQLEGDSQKFFDILINCMEVTDDDIKGNYDECKCGEMPLAQEELCFDIAKNEEACSFDDDNACDEADNLINQFMKSLPENLRVAMEKAMMGFEEKGFDSHKPKECAGVDSFEDCMLIMAEQHLQYAPEPCREPIRTAIKEGSVRGEDDARKICEKIMFEENAPEGCRGLSPDECAKLFGGSGRERKGLDHGVVFQVCDNIKDSSARLACYDDNSNKVDFTKEYHEERGKSRFKEDFDPSQFDKRFMTEHTSEYVDFAKKDYQYKYGQEQYGQRREGDKGNKGNKDNKGREEHQAKIDKFFAEVYPACQAEGKPWFCDGPSDNPCYCGEAYNYPNYKQQYNDQYNKDYQKSPYINCDTMFCQEGSNCIPGRGCVQSQDHPYPKPIPCGNEEYFNTATSKCEPTSGTASQCYSGSRWDAAYRACVPDCSSGSTWNGRECMKDTQPTTGSGSGSCNPGENWVPEPSKSSGGYCTSGSTTQTNCGPGYHLEGSNCVLDSTTTSPPPSETTSPPPTGSVISGRVIYENEFLRYYFGY